MSRVLKGPSWPWLDHPEPQTRSGTFFRYISHKFEAKLHQEGNDVTAADRVWLVGLGKGSPWVGSIRGTLGRGLTIWSPEVGLGPFFAI